MPARLFALILTLTLGTNATAKEITAAASEFTNHIYRHGSITFRSWNGKAIGMDCDTDLTFFPRGTVHMWEYGYVPTSYRGTYELSTTGRITVHFKNFPQGWPAMSLERDRQSLLLRPEDPSVSFMMGSRGGATMPGGGARYWPFRMLTDRDGKAVLKMIKERGR